MAYLIDSIEIDLFHPGVERMEFIIPRGVINKRLENKRLTPFITPSSQLSEAHSLFQGVSSPFLPTFRSPTDKRTARLHNISSNHAGSRGGAGIRQPASSQPAFSFSRQPGPYIQGGDAPVSKPASLREGLTALPRPGQLELEIPGAMTARGDQP